VGLIPYEVKYVYDSASLFDKDRQALEKRERSK
jgi:hypothetical protein